MAVDDPWAIDGVSLSALEWRRALSGLLLHDADSVSARAGVLSGCGVTVAGLTATVGAGQLVLTPQVGSNASYMVGLTATALAITAQDATYARIDRVIARVYDNSIDGSGQNTAALEIVTGIPSAAPVEPALPSGALDLAQLQVPKSGGGAIVVVDRRTWTAAAGAPRWFATEAERDAAIPVAMRRAGVIAAIGSGAAMVVTVHDGTTWRVIWSAAGWQAYTPTLGPSGWTLGDGTAVGASCVMGPVTFFRLTVTIGSTTAVGGSEFGLPTSPVGDVLVATGVAQDASASGPNARRLLSLLGIAAGNRATMVCTRDETTFSPTSPWTWAAGDVIKVSGWYRNA